jgi:hypothetical protein
MEAITLPDHEMSISSDGQLASNMCGVPENTGPVGYVIHSSK